MKRVELNTKTLKYRHDNKKCEISGNKNVLQMILISLFCCCKEVFTNMNMGKIQ